jgi:hypothetical protein
LKLYPSIGPGAYNVEEVRWCDATYDFLVNQLDDEGRAKRSIPLRTRRPPPGVCKRHRQRPKHLQRTSTSRRKTKARDLSVDSEISSVGTQPGELFFPTKKGLVGIFCIFLLNLGLTYQTYFAYMTYK